MCADRQFQPQQSSFTPVKPILKWAGGKTQLIDELTKRLPHTFGKYIEPFFGGGALFFYLQPRPAVIADINPELVNLYTVVRDDVDQLIEYLSIHKNNKEYFLDIRKEKWENLSAAQSAARTIFLNKTCFNGLYRVNKSGDFNTPFGYYPNPKILDENNLRKASAVLQEVQILQGDYKDILAEYAAPGDLIFLDPPYLPVGKYADFKRYTKEQFYEEDHIELAAEVKRLHKRGCHILLTNSVHPLVHELYKEFCTDVIPTKRHISSQGNRRTGEDTIVTSPSKKHFSIQLMQEPLDNQTLKFPSTRYMGSKNKLLADIWSIASQFNYTNVIDLFSGSGIVSYMFKAKGKNVLANDYMAFSANITKALIENNNKLFPRELAEELITTQFDNDGFVSETFSGLYYSDEDNQLIDSLRTGITHIYDPYQRAIAMAALVRACCKKRPRGIFTYTGMRYNDGRPDLQISLADHFLKAIDVFNQAVFDNDGISYSRHGDAMAVNPQEDALVYIDPPYYSCYSDNEYVRRYHFVEGLVKNWQGVEIQKNTITKKFKSYPTPFSSKTGAYDAFDRLFKHHRDSILLVSYSSNSLPTLEQMVTLIAKYKHNVEVLPIQHRYSFGNQSHKTANNKNRALEYIFVGY